MRYMALLAICGFSASALAGYGASSHKTGDEGMYEASSALDNNPDTCWQVKPDTENEGQTFYLDVPSGKVDKIAVMTGWNKSEKHFKKFHHLQQAKLELMSPKKQEDGTTKMVPVFTETLTFDDKMDWQMKDIADTKVGDEFRGGRVQLTVEKTFAGIDYPNLAMSEIRVHMVEYAEFGSSKLNEGIEFVDTPSSEQDDEHNGVNLIDANSRTYWAALGSDEKPTFTVSSEKYSLSSITFKAGPSTHARAKTIEIEADGNKGTYTLENNDKLQVVQLPTAMGYTGGVSGDVSVTVLEVYPGSKEGTGVAIADIGFRATGLAEF